MMVEPISANDVATKVAEIRYEQNAAQQEAATRTARYIRPLPSTCANTIAALSGDDNRIRIGLAQLDLLTRGFGPKELVFITGFSHSAKTQLLLKLVTENVDRRILLLSLDDSAELIFLKLVCLYHDVNAETLEKQIRQGDVEARRLLQQAASTIFSNLFVVDDSLTLDGVSQCVAEATTAWGAPPELVAIDYLDLLLGGDEVRAKSQALKAWVKDKPFPTVAVHQGTRSNARPGAPITMLSMAYGGEQEASVVIGTRRKRDNQEIDPWERQRHAHTVTVHIPKNKRPPSRKTGADGIDFYLDPDTGVIRPLRENDLVYETGTPLTTSTQAVQASSGYKSIQQRADERDCNNILPIPTSWGGS